MHKQLLLYLLITLFTFSTAVAQSNVLESGDIIEAELTEDMLMVEYIFSASEGDQISVTLSSRQFDALLEIVDEDGVVVASNDDSEGSLNSQIRDFEFNRAGDYTIIVTSSGGDETGSYTLTFETATSQSIAYGDTIVGELTVENSELIYQFEGTEGDVISILMEADIIDTFVSLSTDAGELISDDDSGGSLDALIASFVLPETTTYFINATSFSSSASGDFTLSLNKIESTTIAINVPAVAEMDNVPIYFAFDGVAGQTINVFVRSDSGTLDTRLNLIDVNGNSIATDDDGGYYLDPELTSVPINQTGQHIVIISPNDANVIGEFTIEVNVPEPVVLDCNTSQIITLSDKQLRKSYQLDVTAEQDITFTFNGEQSDLNSLSVSLQLDELELSPVFAPAVDGQLSVSAQVDTSGTLLLITESFTFLQQAYELDITCS